MEKHDIQFLTVKVIALSVIGLLVWAFTPKYGLEAYWILLASAGVWLAFGVITKRKKVLLHNAILIGAFLLVIAFTVHNAGAFGGMWINVISSFFLLAAPWEFLLLAFLGGTAWALTLPKDWNRNIVLLEAGIFGVLGALGESIFLEKGLLEYLNWSSIHAFFTYAVIFLFLEVGWYHLVNAEVQVPKKAEEK